MTLPRPSNATAVTTPPPPLFHWLDEIEAPAVPSSEASSTTGVSAEADPDPPTTMDDPSLDTAMSKASTTPSGNVLTNEPSGPRTEQWGVTIPAPGIAAFCVTYAPRTAPPSGVVVEMDERLCS